MTKGVTAACTPRSSSAGIVAIWLAQVNSPTSLSCNRSWRMKRPA
jgi:hypothetical protein